MLKIAPVKLIGLTALGVGMIACGQPNSPSSAKANSATPDTKVASASIASTSVPQNSENSSPLQTPQIASSDRELNAKSIYAEFDRLTQKACQKQEKVVDNIRYTLCTANDRVVSASSSLANEGDGAGYWLNEQGDIYAIRYFHSDEVLVLMPDDKKTIVELIGKGEIKPTTDEARWNQLELTARDAIVEISEQFDTEKSSKSSDRETVEQVTLKYLNHQAPGAAVKPTINKVAIVDNTALLSWSQGEAGGMTLLKKDGNDWYVVDSGGGAMNLMSLSEAGLTRQTAEALLNQIDPHWNNY